MEINTACSWGLVCQTLYILCSRMENAPDRLLMLDLSLRFCVFVFCCRFGWPRTSGISWCSDYACCASFVWTCKFVVLVGPPEVNREWPQTTLKTKQQGVGQEYSKQATYIHKYIIYTCCSSAEIDVHFPRCWMPSRFHERYQRGRRQPRSTRELLVVLLLYFRTC